MPTKDYIETNIKRNTENIKIKKKTLNPTEISNLSQQDASTTPNLPTRNYKKETKTLIKTPVVDKTQEILYNNSNESESDINGEIQRRRMAEISGQYGTRLQQNSEQQQNRKYTKQEYEQ